RLHLQVLRRFHGLRPDPEGLGTPSCHPHRRLSNDAAGFAPRYGPLSRSPYHRAFDTGLRRQAFPPDAASLLPGLLAATRTGLPPASDDELTSSDQSPTRSTSTLLGAPERLSDYPHRTRRHPQRRSTTHHEPENHMSAAPREIDHGRRIVAGVPVRITELVWP